MRTLSIRAFLISAVLAAAGCGSSTTAEIHSCEPENACTCTDTSTERDLLCTCSGGATCSIDGDNIEFSCDGNAGCNYACGDNCLYNCVGTTVCEVHSGDNGEVLCTGTTTCDVHCEGDCTVSSPGTSSTILRCLNEAAGAVCEITDCNATDCGDGVYTCRTACPEPDDEPEDASVPEDGGE
jgi:hypothetical protein